MTGHGGQLLGQKYAERAYGCKISTSQAGRSLFI